MIKLKCLTKRSTTIEQLKIVNDSTERGIKLEEYFSNNITKNETEKQMSFQVNNILFVLKIYCTSK